MIYSKRRKSVGGGRRKRSNRMSYMSKRTKSSVIRIKQMGVPLTIFLPQPDGMQIIY